MRSVNVTSVARAVAALASLLSLSPFAVAHGGSILPHRVSALEVRGGLPPSPPDVTSLKFGEFFRMPIGPYGLDPSDKLRSLDGKRVRLVGFVVREEEPFPGRFMLSPLPVSLGDQDESLADDLPPTTVYVHLRGFEDRPVPYMPGLIRLIGILDLGSRDEADGRVSTVRLRLDSRTSKQILDAKPLFRVSK